MRKKIQMPPANIIFYIMILGSVLITGCVEEKNTTGPVSVSDLKYRILDNTGKIFFCDPDTYPIARAGVEEEHARERFPDIMKNKDEFQAISKHNGMENIAAFSIDQELLIYREHKKLNAIVLEPSGQQYIFKLRISEGNGSVSNVEGTIDTDGTITILKKEPGSSRCPVCLAENTRIDTPAGPVAVKDMQNGMKIWTADISGNRTVGVILKKGNMPAPAGYRMIHIALSDGRELFVSAGHPTADGRKLGDLLPGDILDGASVVIAEEMPYEGSDTYDILPSGDTGYYWADGVLIGSTIG